jgi:hypothetical protein
MKRWIETRLVKPPEHTVTGRFGAAIMFVGYSRVLDQWWLVANGSVEKIDEPTELFLDDDYIASNLLATPRPRHEKSTHMRRGKRVDQLILEL